MKDGRPDASRILGTRTLAVDWTSLGLTPKDVFEAWRCADTPWAESVVALVDPLLEEASAFAPFRAGWCAYLGVRVDRESARLRVAEADLRPGAIVTAELEGVRGAYLFVATLGDAFDAWTAGFLAKGDVFHGYVADTIGAVTVEAVVDKLETEIVGECRREGLGCTRRFSPGYCGWDVAEQAPLFASLPEGFCGVRLTGSAMMTPRKSVSGIVGVGPGVERAPYPCARCERTDCPSRGDTRCDP